MFVYKTVVFFFLLVLYLPYFLNKKIHEFKKIEFEGKMEVSKVFLVIYFHIQLCICFILNIKIKVYENLFFWPWI